MGPLRLIATSTFGLEALVRREVEAMGFGGIAVTDGRVEFDAVAGDIPRLNIGLRTADRVLVRVGEFPATDFGQLFDRTKELPWEEWIPRDGKLTVIGKCVRSTLASVRSSQSIAHKAVVERLKAAWHTDTLPETGAAFTIQVALQKDVALLTLDTSGPGLHRRVKRSCPRAALRYLVLTLIRSGSRIAGRMPRKPVLTRILCLNRKILRVCGSARPTGY